MTSRFELRLSVLVVAFSAQSAMEAVAQPDPSRQLIDAMVLLEDFTQDDATSIPADLLARAHGIAILPGVFRGGFILGGRRGRGVLMIKDGSGAWTAPAFITLTGGSIGWQAGGEVMDLVLIFANENSVRNMRRGKFTLGGDASAIAGPVGRHATMAVTFRAEVYSYVRSSGLFAGATFEGTRLDIDEAMSAKYYGDEGAAFAAVTTATPRPVVDLLQRLRAAAQPAAPPPRTTQDLSETRTFPLEN